MAACAAVYTTNPAVAHFRPAPARSPEQAGGRLRQRQVLDVAIVPSAHGAANVLMSAQQGRVCSPALWIVTGAGREREPAGRGPVASVLPIIPAV